ncbi:MAG: cytochrome c maturation protein CcmE [Burkholderiaceae bacterium]|jgi:cytochrome c-type biogenesis protein CcmE|nr:cytochrome c maturation protein CcmE [Burkholderiaceae bacterium]
MSAVLTSRRKRLLLLLVVGVLLVAAGAFVKQAFRSNLVFYVTPSELATGGAHAKAKETLRVGGLVQPGSLQRAADGLDVRFTLMDGKNSVPVVYHGVLPDLFAQGKGAIAQGKLDASGTLVATQVLAKHDENYTPPKIHPQGGAQ